VVTEEAKSVTATRKTVPTHVDLAILKALAKLPADRFGTASQLGEALADPRWVDTLPTSVLAARPGKAKRRDVALAASVGALASAVALVTIGFALWPRGPGDAPRSGAVHRTSILLPDSAPLAFVGQDPYGAGRRSLALSPDGSTLVYVAHQGATTRLYRRRLDERRATPLPGTEGAYDVFFSPDGREVGFFVGSELKKIALEGGPPTSLATPEDPTTGAHWASDGRILVSAREGRLPVWVASTGGHPQPLAADAFFFRLSELFPDEKWALGHMFYRVLAMLSLETGNQFVITSDGPVPYREARPSQLIFGTHPRYVPSGHLVYLRQDGVLMALPFDPVGKRTLGDPVPVLEGVRRESSMGYGQYTFSGDGKLVYAAGKSAAIGELVWLDGDGRVDTLDTGPQVYGHFSLSPDGKRLVVIHYPLTTLSEVWLYDLERGLPQKLATPDAVGPVMWWPDGSTLLWSESSFSFLDRLTVIRQHLTASQERDTLIVGAMVEDVSPDGQTLAVIYSTHRPGLLLLPDSGLGEPIVVDEDPTAWGAQFSPDGRWLAWTSGRSGGYEVYVTSTSLTGERYQISTAGGGEPRWSPRGDKLVYADGKKLWAVATPRAEGERFGAPRLVFEGPKLDVPNRGHDISPDGERILLILGPPEDSVAYLNVVTNWFEELRRLAPER